MKKTVSVALSAMLCCAMLFSLVPCVSGEAEGRNLSEHLLIHYDFEGQNATECLQDKATSGTVKDNLSMKNFSNGIETQFSFKDGTVTQINDRIYNGGGISLAAESSADLVRAGTDEGTWFLRFSSSQEPSISYNVLSFRNTASGSARPLYLSLTENGNFTIAPGYYNGTENTYVWNASNLDWLDGSYGFDGSYINLAITFQKVDNVYHCYAYISTAGSTEFVQKCNLVLSTSLTDATGIGLGLFQDYNQVWGTAKGLCYDDVRYYDTVLTTEEMGTVLSTGSFANNPDVEEKEKEEVVLPKVEDLTYTRTDLDSCMIIHYDFEGTNATAKLADKAKNGTSKENLTAVTGTDSLYTFSDGTVKLAVSGGTHLTATASDDLIRANLGEGTWFVRFSSNKAPESWMPIIDFRDNSSSRVFFLAIRSDGNFYIAGDSEASPCKGNQLNPFGTFGYQFDGSWVNLMAVRELDIQNEAYYYSIYVSVGDSTEFEKIGRFKIADKADGLAIAKGINFGLFNNPYYTWPTESGLTLDDVRYYVVALDENEMKSVVGNVTAKQTEDPTETNAPETEEKPEAETTFEFKEAEDEDEPIIPPQQNESTAKDEKKETSAPADGTQEEKQTEQKKSGCGSSIIQPVWMLLVLLCIPFVVSKKYN